LSRFLTSRQHVTVKKIRLSCYWIALVALTAFAACAKLDLGGDGANLVVVAMGKIGPTSVPKYGTINGYAVVLGGSFSGHASLINQWLNQGVLSKACSRAVAATY
jgi:hypothetical protein